MTYLTEDPWPLAIMFAVAAGFFAWNGLRTGLKKYHRTAGICIGLMLIPIVIDALVHTDPEQISESIDDLAQAVIDDDAEHAISFVDDADKLSNQTRQTIQRGLDMVDVRENLRIKAMQIRVSGDTATSDFRANGTVDVRDVTSGRHVASRWLLNWRKSDEGWKITKVTRLDPVNGDPMGTFTAE